MAIEWEKYGLRYSMPSGTLAVCKKVHGPIDNLPIAGVFP